MESVEPIQAYHEVRAAMHKEAQLRTETKTRKRRRQRKAAKAREPHSWREQLILVILKHAISKGNCPPWLKGVRASTHAEDNAGTDLIVSTDVGEIHLQIWANKRTFIPWITQHGSYNRAGVLRVGPSLHDPKKAKKAVFEILTELRRRELHVWSW